MRWAWVVVVTLLTFAGCSSGANEMPAQSEGSEGTSSSQPSGAGEGTSGSPAWTDIRVPPGFPAGEVIRAKVREVGVPRTLEWLEDFAPRDTYGLVIRHARLADELVAEERYREAYDLVVAVVDRVDTDDGPYFIGIRNRRFGIGRALQMQKKAELADSIAGDARVQGMAHRALAEVAPRLAAGRWGGIAWQGLPAIPGRVPRQDSGVWRLRRRGRPVVGAGLSSEALRGWSPEDGEPSIESIRIVQVFVTWPVEAEAEDGTRYPWALIRAQVPMSLWPPRTSVAASYYLDLGPPTDAGPPPSNREPSGHEVDW